MGHSSTILFNDTVLVPNFYKLVMVFGISAPDCHIQWGKLAFFYILNTTFCQASKVWWNFKSTYLVELQILACKDMGFSWEGYLFSSLTIFNKQWQWQKSDSINIMPSCSHFDKMERCRKAVCDPMPKEINVVKIVWIITFCAINLPKCLPDICVIFFKKMGQFRPLFLFIFVFSTRHNLNSNLNWKKHRWCAWESNPGWQDGRRERIHWATAAPLLCKVFVNFNGSRMCGKKLS